MWKNTLMFREKSSLSPFIPPKMEELVMIKKKKLVHKDTW